MEPIICRELLEPLSCRSGKLLVQVTVCYYSRQLIGERMTEDKRDPECGDGEGGEQMSEAEIDYNVMGSFPASDPPSWTLGVTPEKTCHEVFDGEKPSVHDPSHQNEPPQPE